MCASKTKTEIIDYTKNMGAVKKKKKIGLGAGPAKPMELCAQRINITQSPNKNTQVSHTWHVHLETGQPLVAASPTHEICCFLQGTGRQSLVTEPISSELNKIQGSFLHRDFSIQGKTSLAFSFVLTNSQDSLM